MTLILVKKRPELSMTRLMFLVLKWIYEEKTMPADEVRSMEEGFMIWSDYFKFLKERNFCRICNGSRFRFGSPCLECSGQGFIMGMTERDMNDRLIEAAKLYQMNDDGQFDKRKKMFKDHKIDWKKFHRLPGSVTDADRARGQAALEQSMKDNPEDYE